MVMPMSASAPATVAACVALRPCMIEVIAAVSAGRVLGLRNVDALLASSLDALVRLDNQLVQLCLEGDALLRQGATATQTLS
jgi:hypothetical protein